MYKAADYLDINKHNSYQIPLFWNLFRKTRERSQNPVKESQSQLEVPETQSRNPCRFRKGRLTSKGPITGVSDHFSGLLFWLPQRLVASRSASAVLSIQTPKKTDNCWMLSDKTTHNALPTRYIICLRVENNEAINGGSYYNIRSSR